MRPQSQQVHLQGRALPVLLAGIALAGGVPRVSVGEDRFEREILPFLKAHCVECHRAEKKKGDLELDGLTAESSGKATGLWEGIAKRLRAGEMPPRPRARPPEAEVKRVLAWIDEGPLAGRKPAVASAGRVTMRRLNRYEYNYTVRDLIGLDLKLADDFPADEVGYGFDNIGDVLTIPPLLLERYLGAAEKILAAAIDAEGPASSERSAAHRRIIFIEPKARAERRSCAQKILERFATRAWRRPARPEEVARLLKLYDLAEKESFERGIQVACTAVLSSPHFLYRVELDAQRRTPGSRLRALNDWELASRLSYFLWSSCPDDKLFERASKGELRNARILEGEALRLLRDGRSRGLLKTFSALWLGSRQMKVVSPDPARFPGFDDGLRNAMRRETELFFEEILTKDLSILTFLDSDFTFLNEKLAKHYGIPGVKGDELRRVSLADPSRGGVLTQGTVLTVTSNPTRTSPVKRGKWILEQILGEPPPPPLPGTDNLPEGEATALRGTLRQRTEQHRKNPECASCHLKMDPLGFALERYDAVGALRKSDGELPIDDSAELPDGTRLQGIAGLKQALLARKKAFARTLSEKLLTFALGRGLDEGDRLAVDGIVARLEREDLRFSALVMGIVTSEPFLYRVIEPGADASSETRATAPASGGGKAR